MKSMGQAGSKRAINLIPEVDHVYIAMAGREWMDRSRMNAVRGYFKGLRGGE